MCWCYSFPKRQQCKLEKKFTMGNSLGAWFASTEFCFICVSIRASPRTLLLLGVDVTCNWIGMVDISETNSTGTRTSAQNTPRKEGTGAEFHEQQIRVCVGEKRRARRMGLEMANREGRWGQAMCLCWHLWPSTDFLKMQKQVMSGDPFIPWLNEMKHACFY